jgi:hypothetical protein
VARLNLDSSGAFAVASHTVTRHVYQFSTADYTCEQMSGGEPT